MPLAPSSSHLAVGSQMDNASPPSKLDPNTIAQAFAYHKVLIYDDIKDIKTDDEDECDDSDSPVSMSWVDEYIEGGKENGDIDDDDGSEETDENNGGNRFDVGDEVGDDWGHRSINERAEDCDGSPDLPLWRVFFDSTLVLDTPQSMKTEEMCDNARLREGLWVVAQRGLIEDLTRFEMGFLSQVANIGLLAKLHSCRNESCHEIRMRMDKFAPKCEWPAFRDWALTAMSCQAAMDDQHKVSPAHTHIAQAVTGLCMSLKKCLQAKNQEKHFVPFLDGDREEHHRVDLAEVSNLIYWMARIQAQVGIGPKKFGKWNHHLLPSHVTLPSIEAASQALEGMDICKNRLWNLVNVSDRKQSDLPDIVSALSPYKAELYHKKHNYCTPDKCQWAQMDSTGVTQLHKCKADTRISKDTGKQDTENKGNKKGLTKSDCSQISFPVELLETALEMGKGTAWLCKSQLLSGLNDPYIAISHVWSDGTGVGSKNAGTVNACLFEFFTKIAVKLKCKAIWWDSISIPKEPKARSKALNMMHSNYANAKYTVVHDTYLLNFPWKDDGSPCIALVLSTWFTRGWTALELFMSKKVIVLFKDPNGSSFPVMRDLDVDILAKSPSFATRAHWLATTLIQRLRKPIDNVGELLAVLSPRSTSSIRDRTIISALLAGVPNCDFTAGETIITTKVLEYVGKIPYTCLLHGKPTVRDREEYSWCAATLDDMPVDSATDLGGSSISNSSHLLEIDESGAVEGKWRWRLLQEEDSKKLRAFGNDLAAVVKIDAALRRWERCLLLRHPSDRADSEESRALLVIPTSVIGHGPVLKCRYIGAVIESRDTSKTDDENFSYSSEIWTIKIGGTDAGGIGMRAKKVKDLMAEYINTPIYDSDGNSVKDDDSKPNPEPTPHKISQPVTEKLPKWIRFLDRVAESPQIKHPKSRATEDLELPEMSEEHLLIAIKLNSEEAARYLVANGIYVEYTLVDDILPKFNMSDEVALERLQMLGDIFADNSQFLHAASMYASAISAFSKLDLKRQTMERILRLCHTTYCLGKVVLRMQKTTSTDVISDALNHFDFALMCSDNRKRIQAKKRELSKRPAKQDPRLLKRPNASSLHYERVIQAIEENVENDTANQIRYEKKWYRLELNIIAEATLLHVARFDLKNASKTYSRALENFGTSIDDTDGLESFWASRQRQPFEEKNKADERAIDIYQRAIRLFDTMFHKDHVLIAITSLHLGIKYVLRSLFSEAESQLRRALETFKVYLSQYAPNYSTSASPGHEEWHPIIGLTHYHLGLLLIEQEELQEAQNHLAKAQGIGASSRSVAKDHVVDAVVLELSATYALGKSELLQQRFNGANKRFSSMIKTLARLPQSRDTKRLEFQANLGLSRVLLAKGKIDEALSSCINNTQSGLPRQNDFSYDLDICEANAFLGDVYMEKGELQSAEGVLKTALDGFKFLQGDKSYDYLQVARKLGAIYGKNGKQEAGRDMLLKAYQDLVEIVGSHHISTLQASWQLGQVYLEMRNLEAASEACEKAYNGFRKITGPKNRLTADTARTLGHVFFEQGKLSKAKEMYETAFDGFKAVAETWKFKGGKIIKQKSYLPKTKRYTTQITGESTLMSAVDIARVSALIQHTQSYENAEENFKLAIEGFRSSDKINTLVGLDAQLQLGCFYYDRRRFGEAEIFIEHALKGFLNLKKEAPPVSKIKANDLEVKISQAKLALGQLLFDGKKECESYNARLNSRNGRARRQEVIPGVPNDVDPKKLIEESRERLLELLGRTHMLTLSASAVLGEIYTTHPAFIGESHTQRERRRKEGASMLEDVRKTYKHELCLAPGHPKVLKVLEILISFYDEMKLTKALNDTKERLWEELENAHGVDVAAMIMDMRNVRRPAWGDSNGDGRNKRGENRHGEELGNDGEGSEEDSTSWNSDSNYRNTEPEARDQHRARYTKIDDRHRDLGGKKPQCPVCQMALADEDAVNVHLDYYAGIDEQHDQYRDQTEARPYHCTCDECFSDENESGEDPERTHDYSDSKSLGLFAYV